MAFCYFFVFGRVFEFIANFAPKSVTVSPDIEAYFNFVLGMFMAFGLAFEVPGRGRVLVMSGLVSVEQLREFRSYAVVAIFTLAAFVTPPDAVSQLSLAIPHVPALRDRASSSPRWWQRRKTRADAAGARRPSFAGYSSARRAGGACRPSRRARAPGCAGSPSPAPSCRAAPRRSH